MIRGTMLYLWISDTGCQMYSGREYPSHWYGPRSQEQLDNMLRLEPRRKVAPMWWLGIVTVIGAELFYFFGLFQFTPLAS